MSCIEYTQEHLERYQVALAYAPVAFEPMALAREVAQRYGVDLAAMLGPRRLGTLPKARRALYVALRARGWSYPQIGAFVGGRHHATVISAVKGPS